MSATYVVTTGVTTGVADMNNPEVRVFPNPADETIFVQASVPATVNVSGVEGKVIISNHPLGAVDIRALAPGLYIVSVIAEDGTQLATHKVVKK